MPQREKAKQHYDRGIDAYRVGEYEDAKAALLQAQILFADADSPQEEAEALNDLGVVCTQLEEWEEAEQYLQAALSLRRQLEERSAQGITLGNLGMLYAQQAEDERAAEAYQQAIAIFRELGERGNEKAVTRQLNRLQIESHQFIDAISTYSDELQSQEELSGPQKVARRLFQALGFLGVGAPTPSAEELDVDDENTIDLEPESDGE